MKHLVNLRARLKEITGTLTTLSEKDSLTAEEIKQVTDLSAEAKTIEGQIKDLEEGEATRARGALPANAPVDRTDENGQRSQVRGDLNTSQKIGLIVMGMVHAYAEEGTRGWKPTARALQALGYEAVAKEFDGAQKRTLNSTNATAGGVLLPDTMSSDVVALLRPQTTFLQGNPVRVPMPNGTFKQPAAASGATAAYRGETRPAAVSQPTFRAINMSAKLLAGIVPISNQLIRYSLPDIQAWVERDLSAAMGQTMDLAAYRGDGMQDYPLGITKIPGIYSVAATNSLTPTLAQIEGDAAKLELQIENSGLPQLGIEWRMAPRVLKYLQNMRDGNGNRVYPELSDSTNPRWRNYPVRATAQIPTNLGGGTDESEIYLVAFGHVLFGDAMAMQLAISDVATIVNGSQTINAFQDGVTVLKAEAEHDFDIRYAQAVNMLTAVRWGG